jgi:hypothetical protein
MLEFCQKLRAEDCGQLCFIEIEIARPIASPTLASLMPCTAQPLNLSILQKKDQKNPLPSSLSEAVTPYLSRTQLFYSDSAQAFPRSLSFLQPNKSIHLLSSFVKHLVHRSTPGSGFSEPREENTVLFIDPSKARLRLFLAFARHLSLAVVSEEEGRSYRS